MAHCGALHKGQIVIFCKSNRCKVALVFGCFVRIRFAIVHCFLVAVSKPAREFFGCQYLLDFLRLDLVLPVSLPIRFYLKGFSLFWKTTGIYCNSRFQCFKFFNLKELWNTLYFDFRQVTLLNDILSGMFSGKLQYIILYDAVTNDVLYKIGVCLWERRACPSVDWIMSSHLQTSSLQRNSIWYCYSSCVSTTCWPILWMNQCIQLYIACLLL